jgi:hypothetical protein
MLPPELTEADRPVPVVDVDSRRTVPVPRETVEELTPAGTGGGAGSDDR